MDDLLGEHLGRYRLIARLGSGGMGVVYVGEHTLMGRKAALKVLHATNRGDPRAVGRLFDEARAVGRIAHPGIVEIYDCDICSERGPYIVMELLEGENLWQRLQRQARPPWAFVASLLGEVAEALAAAHAAGVVHRDLKPGNIFLVQEGVRQFKVLDFGIAALMDSSRHSANLGQELLGTPKYMAPEQCLGDAVGPAADTYALGVIAYELLAGNPPFVDEDSGQVLQMHVQQAVPPIGERGVDGVLARALAKEPRDRLTVREFASELSVVLGYPLPQDKRFVRRETTAPGKVGKPQAATEVPPTWAPRNLGCPRCADAKLAPLPFGEVELDRCQRCSGLWIDGWEREALSRESLAEGKLFRGRVTGRSLMRCPACSGDMFRRRLPMPDPVEVDVCDGCGGVWLDDGELAQLQRAQAEELLRDLDLPRRRSRG